MVAISSYNKSFEVICMHFDLEDFTAFISLCVSRCGSQLATPCRAG